MGKLPRTVGFAGQCLRVELLPFLMSSLQPQTRGGWPCVHTWVFSILYWPCAHTWVISILCNSPLSCFSPQCPQTCFSPQRTNVLILVFSPQYSFAYHGVKRHTPPLCVLSALHTSLASLLYSRSQRKKILQFCVLCFLSVFCVFKSLVWIVLEV